jgi:hypothetical protein
LIFTVGLPPLYNPESVALKFIVAGFAPYVWVYDFVALRLVVPLLPLFV